MKKLKLLIAILTCTALMFSLCGCSSGSVSSDTSSSQANVLSETVIAAEYKQNCPLHFASVQALYSSKYPFSDIGAPVGALVIPLGFDLNSSVVKPNGKNSLSCFSARVIVSDSSGNELVYIDTTFSNSKKSSKYIILPGYTDKYSSKGKTYTFYVYYAELEDGTTWGDNDLPNYDNGDSVIREHGTKVSGYITCAG